ncbi:uncharacterized protein [Triticum aestivum]|uniref:uncharacterized protein n=1 Tax=Triticum aestivum TaxID=4565 RepID=UPI001D01DCB9|nr:uncharacterized protein LOC123096643 [Triticum aestivum]
MAEEAAWRVELRARLTSVQEDVDGLFSRLDRSVAALEQERLHGRDAPTTTSASARGTVEAALDDLSELCASLGVAAADMLEIEKGALAGGSDDQAAPLLSIQDFHGRDEGAFHALLGLQSARAHAGDARGSVESACGFMRAAGLILGTQPRPPRVGVILNHKRLGAVNALRGRSGRGVTAVRRCGPRSHIWLRRRTMRYGGSRLASCLTPRMTRRLRATTTPMRARMTRRPCGGRSMTARALHQRRRRRRTPGDLSWTAAPSPRRDRFYAPPGVVSRTAVDSG